jgi:hypothetical protein
MDDATSIGEELRSKRESRSLGLQEVHDATKITPQNLEALEQNRFDAFPNKVYARAFLRDYANFLDLDSAALLARYEEEWGATREVAPTRPPVRSPWRVFGYAVIVVVVLAGAGTGAYLWWIGCEPPSRVPRIARGREAPRACEEAVLPPQPKPAWTPEPKPTPKKPEPVPAPPPAAPEKITLDVTALRNVWVRVKCDGKKTYEQIMPKGASQQFEAKEAINIRAGMAGAVQLKLNGVPQQPLGTLRAPGEKTFRRDGAQGSPP